MSADQFQPSENPALLQLQDVACERDDQLLFAPISLAVKAGQIVQLEGPNGVGKTSLLRSICGLSSRYRGEMLWRGQSLAKMRTDFAAESLYLGHHAGLKAALNARENLLWWAALRGIDAKATADNALAQVGLAGYELSPSYQLSAGQQRRVALARLFIADVPLWILDEPFTAIDKTGVAELESWLADHAKRGGAILLTTHQPLAMDALIKVELSAADDTELDFAASSDREVAYDR